MHGVSAGRMDDLVVAALGDCHVSTSEVSRICAGLEEDVPPSEIGRWTTLLTPASSSSTSPRGSAHRNSVGRARHQLVHRTNLQPRPAPAHGSAGLRYTRCPYM